MTSWDMTPRGLEERSQGLGRWFLLHVVQYICNKIHGVTFQKTVVFMLTPLRTYTIHVCVCVCVCVCFTLSQFFLGDGNYENISNETDNKFDAILTVHRR